MGCYACYSICPSMAIRMEEDSEGFRYPFVNSVKCTQCGSCERVCPGLHFSQLVEKNKPNTWAAINPNSIARKTSSSGGIFSLLAETVLNSGGIVFGAAFDDVWEVHHISIENKENLKKLKVSKYLQSRIEDSYKKVKSELKKKREVLFVGTPCQTVGLQKFLGCKWENLVLVDFICHGVPSPAVWRAYIRERVVNIKDIQNISFRDKKLSWESYLLSFYKKDNKYLAKDLYTDLYLRGFLHNLYLRPSCHHCKFCQQNRLVDITLGDFWGIGNIDSDMYDGKGTSLVFTHSKKGVDLIASLQVKKKQVSFDEAVKYNPSVLWPSKASPNRTKFFVDFQTNPHGLYKLIDKYTKPTYYIRMKNKIKQILGV